MRVINYTYPLILWMLLIAACVPRPENIKCPTVPGMTRIDRYIDGQGHTGISGQVLLRADDQPLVGAYVNIYPDTITNLLGPSQFISSPTDEQGRYLVDLPPGTYYVVARKRLTGDPTGPLSPGDFYSEHQRILTEVVSGKLSLVNLPVVVMKSPMFFKKIAMKQDGETGIRGRLVDRQGKPVPGGFAMAYTDADMKRLPDFASTLTDAEGRFTIYMPNGGTFYLAARIHVWDMPQTGEPYGMLEAPVIVENGKFAEGIQLEMEPFTGVYKKGKSQRPF